jgi:hypothetical protein
MYPLILLGLDKYWAQYVLAAKTAQAAVFQETAVAGVPWIVSRCASQIASRPQAAAR